MTEDQIVLGQNFVWSVFGALVAGLYILRVWQLGLKKQPAAQLMLGIALVALGSSVHRGDGFPGRLYRNQGDAGAWEFFADWAAIGLTPFIALVVAGSACHISPVVQARPVVWIPSMACMAVGTFLIGAAFGS